MWSPQQYERFKAERQQPFRDLASLVEPRPHMRIVDLGCGTGELTRELQRHFQAAETIGIDSSETMLTKAAAFAGDSVRLEQGAIEDYVPDAQFELVFSNAALHWVADHVRLFTRMAGFLRANGQ